MSDDLRLLLYFTDDDQRILTEILVRRNINCDYLALCQDDYPDFEQIRETYAPHVVVAFSFAKDDIAEIIAPFVGYAPIFILVHYRNHLAFVPDKHTSYSEIVQDVIPLHFPLHPLDLVKIIKNLLADIDES